MNTHQVLLNVVCEELGLSGYKVKHPLKQFMDIVDAFKEIQVNLTESELNNQILFNEIEINRCKDAELFVALYKKINQLQMQGKKEEDIMQLAVYPRVREMLEYNKDITEVLGNKIQQHKEMYNPQVGKRLDEILISLKINDLFDNKKCLELKQEVINVNSPKQTMKM